MRHLLSSFLLGFAFLFAFCPQANASHVAGAEMTYVWQGDSTYRVIYHFYRDCSGITPPDSISICYYNTCDGITHSTYLAKTTLIHDSLANGTDLWPSCPSYPDVCHGGTLPGYQEWWYAKDITLPVRCSKWVFAHTESARNGSLKNITADNLYVEATLNNELAQGNSSAFFALKPVVMVCEGVPYTYSTGPTDIDGDSLYFESVTPRTSGSDCGPSANETYFTGYSLPANPLACSGTFVTDHGKGQMTFTANLAGDYALAMRITEYRYIHGSWQAIGQCTRDMSVLVGSCSVQPATVSANVRDTVFETCATGTINFCFDVKGADTSAKLAVTDNSQLLGGTVSYTNVGTDSVRACFSWTPPLWDTGLHSLLITARDSSCNASISVPNSFVIPIEVYPTTKIVNDTNALCVGDSVLLLGLGGTSFNWNVLPGGSPLSSLSCTSCRVPVARPTITTTYVVQSVNPGGCNNKDTVTITVRSTPFVPYVYVVSRPGSGITYGMPVLFIASVFKGGLLPTYEWFKNGVLVPGVGSSVYSTDTVGPGDVIRVLIHSSAPCVNPDTASNSIVVLSTDQLIGNIPNISLFPNPNGGSFTLNGFLQDRNNNKVELTVTSITGQLVYQHTVQTNNGKLNSSITLPGETPAGVYTIRLVAGTQAYYSLFTLRK